MAHGVIILRYTQIRIIRNCSWTHSRRNRKLHRAVALFARQLQLRARREEHRQTCCTFANINSRY